MVPNQVGVTIVVDGKKGTKFTNYLCINVFCSSITKQK